MKNLFDDRERKRKWFGQHYRKNRKRLLAEYAAYRNSHKSLLKAKLALRKAGVRKSNVIKEEVATILHLRCRDCETEFLSKKTRANHPPSFCAVCRVIRTFASKRVHDQTKRKPKKAVDRP